MTAQYAAYLVFGLALCGVLGGIAVHYFSRTRKDQVEQAKYRMLDDDE
ncbi:MAG TPA: CcoQ/FixQ family Cbb3-type cytochrome c oxidase assembly chaperone [Anaeromyxobacteraceae bacterium]|nr:CcoQ/FixQ family Cbb3-type cytochrome c oxidase assembly chaperone [Anaeromyxobacteraceae bacterium]